MSTIREGYKFNNSISSFVTPVYTLSLTGSNFVYTPNQGTNREKYFNHITFKEKNADSGGK